MNVDKLKCCTSYFCLKVSNLKHFNAFRYSLLFILIMAVGFYGAVSRSHAANEAILAIVPASPTVGIGESFNLTIEIDNLPPPNGAVGFQFELKWNASILTGINITDVFFHSVAPDNLWQLALSVNSTDGTAKYTYTFQDLAVAQDGGYSPVLGNHTLAVLTLTGASKGNSPVTITTIKVGDAVANHVPCTAVNATVAVGDVQPVITVYSPGNNTVYKTGTVALGFAINKPTSWIGYSLDGHPNVTVSGNTDIQAQDGRHVLIIYANDSGNKMGASDPVMFATDTAPPAVSLAYESTAEYMFGNFRWEVNFTAAGSNDTGSGIASYYWDFGDGKNETTPATVVSVDHLYRETGSYDVTLNVTDLAGYSATKTMTVTISPASPPLNLPLELVLAIIVPAVWVPVLGYYFVRGSRKRKFRKLK